MADPLPIPLRDLSQVGEARRRAGELAASLDFDETTAGKVSIVATEMAGNVVKHAREGQLLLRGLEEAGQRGIELLAIDKGPGMANFAECLRDGYSTAGSPGTGLGAITRLSTSHDVYSQEGGGTVLMARLWPKPAFLGNGQIVSGGVCVPVFGEHSCGDAFAIIHLPERYLVVLADGLGHGVHAAKAAEEALRIARQQAERSPGEILQTMQGALRSTRGASVAIAEISSRAGAIRYAAVGNISAVLPAAQTTRSLLSHNGTVGHEVHRVQELIYPWTNDSLLIMHSDGLQTRWGLEQYAGLRFRHPSVIAGVLYRDFQRGRDDVTVVALRPAASTHA